MLQQMPVQLHEDLGKLAKSATRRLQPLTFGSACSGTDICVKVMEAVDEVLDLEYGITCRWKPVFAAESNAEKRDFLLAQYSEGMLFENARDLSLNFANDVRSGRARQLVPQAAAFAAGFSCVSRSPCNKNAKKFKHCLREGTPCPTQETYEMTMAYIRSARPTICWLENVKELESGDHGTEDINDLAYIKDELRSLNYYTQAWLIDALDYGSVARRKRLFVLGVILDESIADSPEHHLWLEQFCERFLNVTKIGSKLVSDFVDLNHLQQEEPMYKSSRLDANFRDDHSAFYRVAGLKWPPPRSALEHLSTVEMQERQIELAFLVDALFPRPDDLNINAQEFIDVNQSACRLLDANPKTIVAKEEFKKNPWSLHVPTLTSSGTILMRWILPGEHKHVLRLVTPLETMALIGWTENMWAQGTLPAIKSNRSLLCDLAGNAFSGFSFAPLVACGIAVAGCTADVVRLAASKEQVQTIEDSSSSGETD